MTGREKSGGVNKRTPRSSEFFKKQLWATFEINQQFVRLITLPVRTCRPLANERRAHAAGVLCQHFDVVGGSRLQVGQSVRAHVSNEEVDGLVHAWKHRAENEKWVRNWREVKIRWQLLGTKTLFTMCVHVWLTAMVLLRLTCRGVDQLVSLDGCSHRVPGHPEARVPLVRDPKVSGTQHSDFDTEKASNFRHGKHQHAGLKYDANVQVPKNCSSSISHLDWLQKWLSQLKLSNFPDEPWIASFKSYLIKLKANLVNYGPIKSERRFIVWVERGEQQENFWLFKLKPLQLHVQQNRNRSTSELLICSLHLNDTELYFGCFSFL